MVKPTNKHKIITAKERENFLLNDSRKHVWETILGIFLCCKDILEVKSKENPDVYADNTNIDVEMTPYFEKLVQLMSPFAPFLKAQKSVLDSFNPEGEKPN